MRYPDFWVMAGRSGGTCKIFALTAPEAAWIGFDMLGRAGHEPNVLAL
jgi:hypothetical protein